MTELPPARQRAIELLAGLDEPEDLLGDVISDAESEVADRFGIADDAPAELQIRLQGERARDGFYDPDVEAELSGPIGKELSAALGKAKRSTKLGLVNISDGSVVLHYRVQELAAGDEDEERLTELSTADRAVRNVLDLHRLFERQASAAEVGSFASRHNGLLKASRGVVEALAKFDLDMSATWRSPSGERVRSVLSQRGRDYAQGLFQRLDETEPIQVIGKVAVLDIDGAVTIATSGKHRTLIELDPEQVDEFSLGESAAIWADVIVPTDRVGLKGKARHRFLRHIEPTEPLWSDSGE